MSKKLNKKPLAATLGTAAVTALSATGIAQADSNPFGMSDLSSGYMTVAEKDMAGGSCGAKMKKQEAACGEGKCGGSMKQATEAKCGEGKCAGNKVKAAQTEVKDAAAKAENTVTEVKKKADGSCGGMMAKPKSKYTKSADGKWLKSKEGSCGGDKPKDGSCGGMMKESAGKKAEGSCGAMSKGSDSKKSDGSCGAAMKEKMGSMKGKDGSCGGMMDKMKGKMDGMKGKDGSCGGMMDKMKGGEASCGAMKKGGDMVEKAADTASDAASKVKKAKKAVDDVKSAADLLK